MVLICRSLEEETTMAKKGFKWSRSNIGAGADITIAALARLIA
jgi:hypothetical protein